MVDCVRCQLPTLLKVKLNFTDDEKESAEKDSQEEIKRHRCGGWDPVHPWPHKQWVAMVFVLS